jgi:hypothetical protein
MNFQNFVVAMSQENDRQNLFLDMYRCFETVADDLVSCDIQCLETRTGIGYFSSVASAERAFFMIVMDCDAVYLEENTLVLRRIHQRQEPVSEPDLKDESDHQSEDDCTLSIQTFDAMVYNDYDDDTDHFS